MEDIIYEIERLEEIYKTTKSPVIAAKLSQLFFEASKRAVNKSEVDYCITSAIIYFKKAFPSAKSMKFSENPYLAREELSVRLSSFLSRGISSLGAVAP